MTIVPAATARLLVLQRNIPAEVLDSLTREYYIQVDAALQQIGGHNA